jgi:zinc/manganese transport system permease protein
MSADDLGLLAAPFVAGLLVLATHVPLGIEVLRRGIIFIDLAVAQVAALGVIAAGLLQVDDYAGGLGAQLAAGVAALVAAALLTWTERRWPKIQEALIGLLFVLAAAIGFLLLAGNPHGGERLRDLLVGQILWVNWERLLPVAVLYLAILAAWRFPPVSRALPHFRFYALFAIAVTASVQLVGVYLVFASLIAPAVASLRYGERRLLAAGALGVAAYATGLAISLVLDYPAGATIVVVLVVTAFGSLLAGRRSGETP